MLAQERLIALGLGSMAKALDDQRRQPDIAALSFVERLALLLDALRIGGMTASAGPLALEGAPPDEGEWEQAPLALRRENEAPVLSVGGFEGPLGCLLELVRTHRLDLSRLSIVALVETFATALEQALQQDGDPTDSVFVVALGGLAGDGGDAHSGERSADPACSRIRGAGSRPRGGGAAAAAAQLAAPSGRRRLA
ncbi:IstB-like ATP-binding domain-containing protein [Lichenicoccus roseus]|uniref:Uncharacterized protein n=1 Tax=Lichenicoccus roseus TaxID=2683649 RepID=A0A5R9IZ43_9PROT|nr:IstB-like ATP-binding domain-containing protein [Lichenicoccus roseus]TLU70750.1 hypothetical protein FE263_20525 [Lichenicoccus roseus]